MSIVRFTSPVDVDSAFNDLVRRSLGTPTAWTPAADIHLEGPDAVLSIELPGVNAGDVTIDVKDRSLIVSGTRGQGQAEDQARVLRREIRRGSFSRAFRLPAHVAADAVKASYEAGILTIRIDGAQPAPVSQRITIENLGDPVVEETSTEYQAH